MKVTATTIMSAVGLAFAGIASVMTSSVCAEEMMEMSDHHAMTMDDPHAHHHMVMPETTRRTAVYSIPDINLVRDDGKNVSLVSELDDGRPVVLSFIYTTCTTICPVTSQTLAQLQQKLGADRERVHIVSISIDPEQDTPARLAEYAKKFHAGPEWQHYTGTIAASIAAQRAFDVYRGDKMNHVPVTLLRAAPGQPWTRIDGFATTDDLLGELRSMLASR